MYKDDMSSANLQLLLNMGHRVLLEGLDFLFYLLQINSKCPFKWF